METDSIGDKYHYKLAKKIGLLIHHKKYILLKRTEKTFRLSKRFNENTRRDLCNETIVMIGLYGSRIVPLFYLDELSIEIYVLKYDTGGY